ncbi:phage tail tip fiber protein [Vibrio cholerae]|uniref:phage tail tip fiber protein n=1 Tax=Vibrio cholerae TaxID=666 RepID=UPI003080447B
MAKRSPFRAGRSLEALYENVEILTGQRGDGRYRAVTEKEVVTLNAKNAQSNVNQSSESSSSLVQVPHAPHHVQAFGGFTAILVQWDTPQFRGFAYAEVWRANHNDFSQAVVVATTPANVFSDVVNAGSRFYYWVRFINTKNFAGPYHGVNGILGETSQNIGQVIDELAEQLKQSELIQLLQQEISAKAPQTLLEQLDSELAASGELIAQIQRQLKSATETFAAQVTQLHASSLARDEAQAQAGEISAGIGLIAKSDGTSQVAVSASQFFVYDPNKPGTLVPTFAIDNGAVVIPKALIESATIQVLQAQKITADYVKAGIEIASPLINTGKLRGGDAGFGAGGPYNGYHTFIHSNGLLQTNNLQANNGYFRGNIEGTTINGGVIKGATIIASTFYQSVVLYTTFGDNATTSLSYPSALGGGLVVTSESVRVTLPETSYYSDGATAPVDFFPAGDVSINTMNRARYRTIPDGVFNFTVRRPRVGGSGFLQIFVQAINLSGGVVAEARIVGTDTANAVGTTVNVAGVSFALTYYRGGSSGYAVEEAHIASRRSLLGSGWTYSASQSLRFRLRLTSLHDGAVIVNMSASINNSIDPR